MKKQNENLTLQGWNERLDKNLESEEKNDPLADENAEEFSEKYGSSNESHQADGSEDNTKQNQPVPSKETPKDGDIKREE